MMRIPLLDKCDQGNKPKHVICQVLINSENSCLLRRSGKRKAQYRMRHHGTKQHKPESILPVEKLEVPLKFDFGET